MDKNDLDAVKLLADWSKWLVLVETAAITAIGAFWKPEVLDKSGCLSRWGMTITIASFALSIMAAGTLLKSLPAIAQRLPPPSGKDIFHMRSFEGNRGLPIYVFANAQTWLFVVGWCAFVFAIVASVWKWS